MSDGEPGRMTDPRLLPRDGTISTLRVRLRRSLARGWSARHALAPSAAIDEQPATPTVATAIVAAPTGDTQPGCPMAWSCRMCEIPMAREN
jgi:hypothetical protein